MYDRRFTPEMITSLALNEIFVFGSNLAGAHAGGAARVAHRYFGAEWGKGVGLTGRSYAIPTMQGGVSTIQPYVDQFIAFVANHIVEPTKNMMRTISFANRAMIAQRSVDHSIA